MPTRPLPCNRSHTGRAEARFRAMGADAHVIVVGGRDDALRRVVGRVADLERRWSRFVDASEVSALNRAAGRPVRVSPETRLLVERAVDALHLSGGSFDPTVLGAVMRAGYDRTFDEIDADHMTTVNDLLISGADIEVRGDEVRLPARTGFDPGGIGKGLAADLVVEEAQARGVSGICVNLGGDVRVAGDAPDGDVWTVEIRHPDTPAPLARLGLREGAVATSTTLLRTWHADGERRHHIIDPATGAPSDTDLTLASVVSAAGWTSEFLAKSVLLRGARHPFDLLGGTGADALAVDRHGRVQTTRGFERFCGDRPVSAHIDRNR